MYVLATATSVAFGAAAATLDPEQFEVGWPLEVPAGEKIFDVPLTPEVYAHAPTSSQLAVLDANGNTLPFFRASPPAPSATEQRVTLDASPLYANDTSGAIAQLELTTAGGDASVRVTRGGDPASQIVAFAVDARAVETRPVALELDWRVQPQPFLLDVRIEQSRTLTDWRPVGRASVAQLAIAGASVVHKRVPVNADSGGYFRITWSSTLPGWYLERATLVSSSSGAALLQKASASPLAEAPKGTAQEPVPKNALYFDAGGTMPVSAVSLAFAAGNGWASATVSSAASLDGPWSDAGYGQLFYEIDYQGRKFASDPLGVGRREHRYWRVVTAEPLARERVTLVLEYPEEHLRVSGDGVGPYLLAAGTLAKEAGPDSTFAAVVRELPAIGAPPPRATLGPMAELGGAAALDAPYEFPWRLALLWAVLGGGALAVAWMAVRLARDLGKTQA
jgi:hypothetical protein